MSGEGWICRNAGQFEMFCKHIRESWNWDRPISISWMCGIKKTLGQNALVHVWFRAIANHLNATQKAYEYTEEDLKDYLKKNYGERKNFLDPQTGEEVQKLKSLSEYTKGEMTVFMQKIEAYTNNIGCLLPVWGEYEKTREAA